MTDTVSRADHQFPYFETIVYEIGAGVVISIAGTIAIRYNTCLAMYEHLEVDEPMILAARK